jgi:hypothetical protein
MMARVLISVLLLISVANVINAATSKVAPDERFRGGKVEWTRLDTGTPYWDRHSENDQALLGLMRKYSSLNISHEWKSTRADDLAELCTYPFVYSDNIAPLSEKAARNLTEYLRRGGFLLVDSCGNYQINPDPRRFFDAQIKLLRKYIPELRVVELAPEHEVFSIYFKMKEFPPRARPGDGGSWLDVNPTFPLRAVFSGERMIAIIGLNGFQCAWSFHSANVRVASDCMQMVTNIYIYAMTR